MARGAEGLLRLEVFQHLFSAAAEEMGEALMRASFSPNIKERRDFSCALFGRDGEGVAQAAHLPVHLGSAPLSLAAAREDVPMGRGDAVLLNDPFRGGTHLPDLTLVSPVFLEGDGDEPSFYCVNRAHHADVGGAHPGSMAPADDVHGEGLRIPPVRLVRGGEVDRELLALLLANMRVPREREADLHAQLAANRVGARRLEAMACEHGAAELRARGRQLVEHTAALTRAALAELPRSEVHVRDTLELWGGDAPAVHLDLRLSVLGPKGDRRLRLDLTGSDDQVAGPVNTVRAVSLSAASYVLRLLLPPDTPTNTGLLHPVEVRTRPGSLLDARYPAPVASGNVETSQRLVDLCLAAFAELLPERVPAASAGTMSNLTLGSSAGGFSYYETLAGGAGGGPGGPGAHALHTHMTNTRNTPVEALEQELPVRVLATTVRRGSGGAGRHPGGDGLLRRLRVLVDTRVGWSAQRQRGGPPGRDGGRDGEPGGASVRRAGARRDRPVDGQAGLQLGPGDEFEVRTPGGGGHGRPGRRPRGAAGGPERT